MKKQVEGKNEKSLSYEYDKNEMTCNRFSKYNEHEYTITTPDNRLLPADRCLPKQIRKATVV